MSMSKVETAIVYTYLSEVLPFDTTLDDIINMTINEDERIQVNSRFEDWPNTFLASHILELIGTVNQATLRST